MEESIRGVNQAQSVTQSTRRTRSNTSWRTRVLLLGGLVLVAFSQLLGQICVQSTTSDGGVVWSAVDADRVALIFRCLGGMAFAWGLVERVISALTQERPEG